MPVYLPCLNVDQPDDGSGWSISVAGQGVGGTDGTGYFEPGISFTHSDSPLALSIYPYSYSVVIGPNWRFWVNVFGLGETKIERQKEQIQDVLTPIFRYLRESYGVPIRDNHALQFPSDGVQRQFVRRPDIAALVPQLMSQAEIVATKVFADETPGSGKRERVVNQFLANAAYNDWPVNSTVQIWEGIVNAAQPGCTSDAFRWIYNPRIVETAAKYAVLLQYMPLGNLVTSMSRGGILDPLGAAIVNHWGLYPELVRYIPQPQSVPAWAVPHDPAFITAEGVPIGYEGQYVDQRGEVLQLWAGVFVPRAWYPDFIRPQGNSIPVPQPPPPSPTPQPPPPPPPGPQPPPPPPTPQPRPPTPPQGPRDAQPTQFDLDFACYAWRVIRSGGTLDVADQLWQETPWGSRAMERQRDNPNCFPPQSPSPTPGPQPPPSPPTPQPPPRPPSPQPPPQPRDPQPTQFDLDFACYAWTILRSGQVLDFADELWRQTPWGAAAMARQQNNPLCFPQRPQPPSPPPNPQPPNPPPPPQPPPTPPAPQPPLPPGCPQPVPPPPRPQPPPPVIEIPPVWPPPQPQPPNCPPACQQQIDLVRQRMEECCEYQERVVVRQINFILRWLIDLEQRVPGPLPGIPTPGPWIPPQDPGDRPGLPLPPVDPDGPDGPLPPLPPNIIQCLIDLCDPDKFKDKVQEHDRELECASVLLCDPTGGIWGQIAECWLSRNTPPPADTQGVLRGRQYPQSASDALVNTWRYAISNGGQQSPGGGQQSQPVTLQGDKARYVKIAERGASMALRAWRDNVLQPTHHAEANFATRNTVFTTGREQAEPQLRYRTLKPRDGEIDPCTGNPQGTGEI